jgi:hypothetical protein
MDATTLTSKHFEHKYETTNSFLDFIDEPQESPVRRRAEHGLGVYGVELFDFDRPVGRELVPESEACLESSCSTAAPLLYSNKTVAVFVLDVRTNKDPWKKGRQAYYSKDYEGDFWARISGDGWRVTFAEVRRPSMSS